MYLYCRKGKEMKKIGIIYGGRSTEHDASLKSKETFINELNQDEFEVTDIIFVDRDGSIKFNDENIDFGNLINKMKCSNDVFYLNLLHGNEGEDGSWCGVMDVCDINGSFESVNTSSVLMNKFQQSCIAAKLCNSIYMPKTIIAKKDGDLNILINELNNASYKKVIIKPNNMGASHFTKKMDVNDVEEIIEFISTVFEYDDEVLIQEFIEGEEYTCGVIRHQGEVLALPIIHVKTNTEFLGHSEKHTHGSAIIDFDKFVEEELIALLSKQLFNIFNIIGMCRFDFLIDRKQNKVFFLEGNLLPGFSAGSAFPRMLKKGNISISEFMNDMIENYTKKEKRNKFLPYNIED